MAYIRRRGCKCPKDAKRCTCGAKWSFTVDIGIDPATGKRKQLTKSGFDTRRDAELAAAEVEAQVAAGTFVKETRTTFEEYADHWFREFKLSGWKPSTLVQKEYHLKKLNQRFAKAPLPQISRKMYREFIFELCNDLGRRTVQEIHWTARAIFRLAVENGDLKSNPTDYVRVPIEKKSGDEEIPKYLEKEELAGFLQLAKRRGLTGDYPFFLLLAYTGMRIGEACALKWKNVDFDEGTISIEGTIFIPKCRIESYQIVSPKTPKSRRKIAVDKIVLEELAAWRKIQNEVRMQHRKTYHDKGFVFGKIEGKFLGYPIPDYTMRYRMYRILRWMKLPFKPTPHTFRHTHVSLLAEAGASLPAIMERVGHEDSEITERIYLHVTKTMKRDAAEKFSELMQNVVKL